MFTKFLVKAGRTAKNQEGDDDSSEFKSDENASTISNASTNMSYQDLDQGMLSKAIESFSFLPLTHKSCSWKHCSRANLRKNQIRNKAYKYT